MPRSDYREGYSDGYQDAMRHYRSGQGFDQSRYRIEEIVEASSADTARRMSGKPKRKRPLSSWNKFVAANSKKPRFVYQSGKKKGKLNLKKMGVAYRKTPAGRKR